MSKRKDTNFKANHNTRQKMTSSVADVCLSAKIRILKQITTYITPETFSQGCLSKRKDTNFKANHNKCVFIPLLNQDVCLSAKIRILKQITTVLANIKDAWPMFV